MARIRSIKPEFPQSESMGRISRDARLFFVMMWTIADDSGRLRGNSRMLASLLFPYDDDAPALIDGWFAEIEKEGCAVRYSAGGQTYIQICNWLIHQKIDKPTPSKIPEFVESSRILASESRSLAVGSKEGKGSRKGEDQGGDRLTAPASPPPTAKPEPKPEPRSTPVWQAYSEAYRRRYGVEPVRNAKGNAQLCQLVDRLGQEAAAVAAYYVGHNKAIYTARRHGVEMLLADAEALRTDWLTGQQSTNAAAVQADRTQTTANVWGKLIAEAEQNEALENG